jgi:hypothetical protein
MHCDNDLAIPKYRDGTRQSTARIAIFGRHDILRGMSPLIRCQVRGTMVVIPVDTP